MITYCVNQMGECEEISEAGLRELCADEDVDYGDINDIIIDLEDKGFVVTINDNE